LYREYLKRSPDPVQCVANRIIRAVSTRQHHGGMPTPAPIISRIFQEISIGNLAYQAAKKIKEVPMPFMYVQFNALLLLVFNLVTPIAIARFTGSILSSVLISMVVVGGYTAVWIIANDLEDPFGADATDLPLMQYHVEYCASLQNILFKMPEDNWRVANGPWRPPPSAGKDNDPLAVLTRGQLSRPSQSADSKESVMDC